MTDHDRTDGNAENGGAADDAARNERDEKLNQALDFVRTPFYAWIGAGVRTVEILGDIGARVRAEEEARDGSADSIGDDSAPSAAATEGEAEEMADVAAGRLRDARRKVRDLGDDAGEQSREAFLKALDAAQLAFNDALTKAQARGDRAFASAHSLPEDVAARAEQLKPEQLRAVADGYLEAASKIYRELAARGEQAVDEGIHVARQRRGAFGATNASKGSARASDPVSAFFGNLPFAGAAADRMADSIEDVARETLKPLQDAGQEFLDNLDQEKISTRVESLLHQAADVTEQLLGALRAEAAAANAGEEPAEDYVSAAESDIVEGEIVDLDGSHDAADAPDEDPGADDLDDAADDDASKGNDD